MKRALPVILLLFSLLYGAVDSFGQEVVKPKKQSEGAELDSLRKKEEKQRDTVIFTAKYIRYTTLKLLKDSVQTLPLDTTLKYTQYYSVLSQPQMPTIGLGKVGLAYRPLLFEPAKTIGFAAGFHALDAYLMQYDDVRYYRARAPFTELYYVSGGNVDQTFKVTHSQNIKKNWNFGANYFRIGGAGSYARQIANHLNASVFTWYQSPNKRYNLNASAVFNTIKTAENGAAARADIFETGSLSKDAEVVNLNNSKNTWRQNGFLIKQSYFVGRIDSTKQDASNSNVLPTNKVTHTLSYTKRSFTFQKDENDNHLVIPIGLRDVTYTYDSTGYTQLQNQFMYSFFLRAKSSSIVKNEVKLDVGIQHDLYSYSQQSLRRDNSVGSEYFKSFQDVSLLGSAGYRFSNKAGLQADVQQVIQGRSFGDFLYSAKVNALLSKTVGRLEAGASIQNKSPEMIYQKYFGNHYFWSNNNANNPSSINIDKTKTTNLFFKYINDRLGIEATANYYLIGGYLYFAQRTDASGAASVIPGDIVPVQQRSNINLLKLSLAKNFTLGKFHLDNYAVYQKTDFNNILRTPELYIISSLYYTNTYFKVLHTSMGFDVRYNSSYAAPSYSPVLGQFYVGDNVTYASKPIADVWVKANLKRANLFLKYEYANQGLFSKGYYTVNNYPMSDAGLKFGLTWNFYD